MTRLTTTPKPKDDCRGEMRHIVGSGSTKEEFVVWRAKIREDDGKSLHMGQKGVGHVGILFEMIRDYFRQDNWNFQEVEDRPVLRMAFSGRNGQWLCIAIVYEDRDQFVFYSIDQSYVPDNQRAAVAEFLTRANYGLTVGNFEMDYEDGEVRYKTSIDFQGSQFTFEQFRALVYSNVFTMDRYFHALKTVMYGLAQPRDAVAEAEMPLPPPGNLC